MVDFLPSRHTGFVIASTVATTLALVTIGTRIVSVKERKIIPSPRETLLPKLTSEERDALAYPPDTFPGARDVASPYGTTRVYEWGSPNGRKILLLHGISTPCVSLGGVANTLVSKGCRVLILDLFGRGYSDSPDLPHDSRLYTTQILLAITSSPLPWTPEGFSIIGYSLGGGIAADFAAYFPHLVKGLALLAPSGLMREYNFGWHNKLVFGGWYPQRFLEYSVRKRLTGEPDKSAPSAQHASKANNDVEKTALAEVKGTGNPHFNSVPLSKNKPHLTVASTVRWQMDYNEGFIRSFVSSVRYSSISGQGETWKLLRKLDVPVVILVGDTDPVIIAEELQEDATAAIGVEKVEWRVMDGGHEFPIMQPGLVVEEISAVWGL